MSNPVVGPGETHNIGSRLIFNQYLIIAIGVLYLSEFNYDFFFCGKQKFLDL